MVLEQLITAVETRGVVWADEQINIVAGDTIAGGTPTIDHLQVALEMSGETADAGTGGDPAVWAFHPSWTGYLLPVCRREDQPERLLLLRGIPVIFTERVPRTRFYLVGSRPDLTVAVVGLDPLAVGAIGYTIESPFRSSASLALASPSDAFRDAFSDEIERLHGAGCSWTMMADGLIAWLAKDDDDDNDL